MAIAQEMLTAGVRRDGGVGSRRSVAIRWPDGRVQRAGSWRELLDLIRMEQWYSMNEAALRKQLQFRTHVWTGNHVRIWGTARRFMHRLAQAGLFEIVSE